MPTVLTHAVVGAGLAVTTGQADSPWCLALSMALAAAPDLDVLGFPLGIPYESFFGHRGFFHSLFAPAVASSEGRPTTDAPHPDACLPGHFPCLGKQGVHMTTQRPKPS